MNNRLAPNNNFVENFRKNSFLHLKVIYFIHRIVCWKSHQTPSWLIYMRRAVTPKIQIFKIIREGIVITKNVRCRMEFRFLKSIILDNFNFSEEIANTKNIENQIQFRIFIYPDQFRFLVKNFQCLKCWKSNWIEKF